MTERHGLSAFLQTRAQTMSALLTVLRTVLNLRGALLTVLLDVRPFALQYRARRTVRRDRISPARLRPAQMTV